MQGKFVPRHPQKYIGNPTEIVYRSSWEKRCMFWADMNPSILEWGSEEIVVPYVCETDNRPHRYFVDFVFKVKTASGEIKKFLVEVKPYAQTCVPIPPRRKVKKAQQRYLEECLTYVKNRCKWRAAKVWAQQRGFEFMILTEKELGIG